MANIANVYAPLYDSVQARGRLSPLGTPGALKPEPKEKSRFGEALGGMIDQLMNSGKASKKERVAQLHKRNSELKQAIKQERSQSPYYNSKGQQYAFHSPNMNREIGSWQGDPNHREFILNPDYIPKPNLNYPSELEREQFEVVTELKGLQGTTTTSGFQNPDLNNQVLYSGYKSDIFDSSIGVQSDQGEWGNSLANLLKFTQ